jgi:hypothetical protein
MGYALVKLGAVSSSLSPSFGQPTTAGNLLVAWVFTNDSPATNPLSTTSPGWVQATPAGGGGPYEWTTVFYKADCGASETAPTFADSGGGSGPLSLLGEFSGGATASVLDSSGTGSGSSTQTATNAAPDAAGGDLIIFASVWNGGNTGGTFTTTMADSSGASVTPAVTGNSGAGGGVTVFYGFSWGVAGAVTGAGEDTATGNLSVYSGGGSAIASFKAAGGGGSSAAPPAAYSLPPAPGWFPGADGRVNAPGGIPFTAQPVPGYAAVIPPPAPAAPLFGAVPAMPPGWFPGADGLVSQPGGIPFLAEPVPATPLPQAPAFITGLGGTPGTGYFTDQYGHPILLLADNPWGLPCNAGRWNSGNWQADYDGYCTARGAQGFTAVYTDPLGNEADGGVYDNGNTWDDVTPCVSGNDPSTGLNPAFWQRIDYFITVCAQNGLTAWLNIANVEYDTFMGSWTGAQWTDWGAALAARYAGVPNIIWTAGNDYYDSNDTQIGDMLAALRAGGDSHLFLVHNYIETDSRYGFGSDNAGDVLALGTADSQASMVYTYIPTYFGVEYAYTEPSPIPVFWGDGYFYGGSGAQFDTGSRQMAWWALASGARGANTGSEFIWQWGSGSLASVTEGAWWTTQAGIARSLIQSLPGWQYLIPDTSGQLVIAGRGTRTGPTTSGGSGEQYGDATTDDYVAASRVPGGTLAVIYFSAGCGSSSITIDQTQLVPGYTATWVDPANGARVAGTPGATYAPATVGSNSAGYADWVLVLQGTGVLASAASRAAAPFPPGWFPGADGQVGAPGSIPFFVPPLGFTAPAGPVTGTGTGALDGTGLLAAAGTRGAAGTGLTDGTGAIAPAGVKSAAGTGVTDGTGTLTAAGSKAASGSSRIAGTGTPAAAGKKAATGTGLIDGTGLLAGTGVRTATGTGRIPAAGTLASAGTKAATGTSREAGTGLPADAGVKAATGSAFLDGTGRSAGAGARGATGTGAIAGTGVPEDAGTKAATGTGLLDGTGAIAPLAAPPVPAGPLQAGQPQAAPAWFPGADGLAAQPGGVPFYVPSTGAQVPAAVIAGSGTAALDGTGELAAAGIKDAAATGTIAVAGTLDGAGVKASTGSSRIAAAGAPAASGVKGAAGSSDLPGSGRPAGAGTRAAAGPGTIAGTGALAVAGTKGGKGSSAAGGTGTLADAGTRAAKGTGTVDGTGTLSPSTVLAGTGATAGTGTLGGSGARNATGTSAITGTGAAASAGAKKAAGYASLPGTGRTAPAGARAAAGTGRLAATGLAAAAGAKKAAGTSGLTGTGVPGGIPAPAITGSSAITGTGAAFPAEQPAVITLWTVTGARQQWAVTTARQQWSVTGARNGSS